MQCGDLYCRQRSNFSGYIYNPWEYIFALFLYNPLEYVFVSFFWGCFAATQLNFQFHS